MPLKDASLLPYSCILFDDFFCCSFSFHLRGLPPISIGQQLWSSNQFDKVFCDRNHHQRRFKISFHCWCKCFLYQENILPPFWYPFSDDMKLEINVPKTTCKLHILYNYAEFIYPVYPAYLSYVYPFRVVTWFSCFS